MMKSGSESWQVTTDPNLELNFAVYLACAFGLCGEQPQSSIASWPQPMFEAPAAHADMAAAWSAWWEDLCAERRLSVEQKQNRLGSSLCDPPEFRGVVHQGLRRSCQMAWPSFSAWWEMPAGGKFALEYWTSMNNLHAFIYKFEQRAVRTVKPFRLHIDVVYTGLTERLELGSGYVVAPVWPALMLDEAWWQKKLQAIG